MLILVLTIVGLAISISAIARTNIVRLLFMITTGE